MIDIIMMVVSCVAKDDRFRKLVERLARRPRVVGISGLWGSSAPIVCAALAKRLDRPLLYVTAHTDEADEVIDDIDTCQQATVDQLPAWEALPGEGSAGGEIHDERLRLCVRLVERRPQVIVAPIQALLQPVPTAAALKRNTLRLECGARRDPDEIAQWLIDRGFERLERIEAPGDFARRGDILDLYPHDRDQPLRFEFFDDRIEAIRIFDPSTHRSTGDLPSVEVAALLHNRKLSPTDCTSFLTYLPDDTLIVLDRPADVQEAAGVFWHRLNQSPELLHPPRLLQRLAEFDGLHITRVGTAPGADEDIFHFNVRSLLRFEGRTEDAVAELCSLSAEKNLVVFCNNEGERQRLEELVVERLGSKPESLHLLIGLIHRGFEWAPADTIVVGHHEIFHRTPARRLRRTHAARPIESALDLAPGDTVVHVVHGIARFRGLKTQRKGESNKSEEYLFLEFADRAMLHVPSSQIDLVQHYIGAGGVRPTLSKLGGTRWKTIKEKVTDAVSELAESLLRVQAARMNCEGVAYPADTRWQREFEESFPYEDTEDQTIVNRELKDDLCKVRPMDRLICGDVGFGKTELAVRAAFKVVEYGKQAAVLVPTTVLAEQHYRTFTQRLAEYPFVVGCLSRFRTAKEQKQLIEQTKKGQIDILIGTHRMLSKDVHFADLGLVVIDEEQRFGVEHKERLKQLRTTVDALTLSATPIPRTLHMAMVGMRDISSLQSPPMDRRAIATQVCPFDEELLRSAVIRELNRDGQIYFIHNVVKTIEAVANMIRALVPEAKVIVGHGQMKEGALEKVMYDFQTRKADILVATTIIESGIDIPNVNTIFISGADRFGLADLHQLRGRVGRSAHRGYCYFLLPPDRPVTPKAEKRLKAIEEFSDLGAGFRIAMRDLEIRGAGNLLGPEQSGHIAAVGYELYCQLLEQAVRTQQGKPDPRPPRVHLELDVAAHIPRSYITSERCRIDVYRRVVACDSLPDLTQLDRDLADAYGKYPPVVQRLLDLAEIRILAGMWNIRSIILQPPDLVFTVPNLAAVQDLFTDAPGTARSPDSKTVHFRLPPNYLEPATLLPILRKLLTAARQAESVA